PFTACVSSSVCVLAARGVLKPEVPGHSFFPFGYPRKDVLFPLTQSCVACGAHVTSSAGGTLFSMLQPVNDTWSLGGVRAFIFFSSWLFFSCRTTLTQQVEFFYASVSFVVSFRHMSNGFAYRGVFLGEPSPL
nr:hypothetical protein [Tanacetum cinerariifolium]